MTTVLSPAEAEARGWFTVADGPWRALARLADYEEAGDGVVVLARHDQFVGLYPVYRFPIGWRQGSVDRAEIPQRAKRLARRAMNLLP